MDKLEHPMRDSDYHVAGASTFTDDWPVPENSLYAAVVVSSVAHGVLEHIDAEGALALSGVVRVITAKDIPGANQIGDIVPDERLLVEDEIKYRGKPVALVLADSPDVAWQAAKLVEVKETPLPAVMDVQSAYEAGNTFGNERTFSKGDAETAFKNAVWVVEGEVDCQAQEHLYFETQASLAIPLDGDRLQLISASQNPSAIQKFTAKVLDLPMNTIEVEVPRLGGAFGGKEEQAKPWALLAALGAHITQRPVKLTLSRQEDMCWTGKRHPYHSSYRLAADECGKFLAYEVKFLQDGGAVADLSTAVLERTLFHATNAYDIPNARIYAVSCRTHHPSNTAFRGFGAPQAVFALECAIDHLAVEMGKSKLHLQQLNLFQTGYQFSYGMTVSDSTIQECWRRLLQSKNIEERMQLIEEQNLKRPRQVKSIALMPLCFGISFTANHLNQASVTVSIYTDGSVSVAMSAVEMGQGVAEKIREVVARSFGLSRSFIKVDYTNSSKTANTSPTAASVGADLNGMAALKACEEIKKRLSAFINKQYGKEIVEFDFKKHGLTWPQIVADAYLNRVDLSQHAFYATPDLYFDRVKEEGNPFAYHVYGVSAVEVTLDRILGTYKVDSVDVVYDLGKSLDHKIDLGQMEGGIVQGVGYVTLESVEWDDEGVLQTESFATYKVPDLLSSPMVNVEFIESENNPHGPFSAKAIGEPPFLLGMAAYFALADAIRDVNPSATVKYKLPMTPEKALLALVE